MLEDSSNWDRDESREVTVSSSPPHIPCFSRIKETHVDEKNGGFCNIVALFQSAS